MQFLSAVVIIGCVAFASAHKNLSEDDKAMLMKWKTECVEETKADIEVVKKAKHDGVFPDDEKLNEFFFCFFKKMGFQNAAGDYEIEFMKEQITKYHDKDTSDKLIELCTKETSSDPKVKAVSLAKCYHENKPAEE